MSEIFETRVILRPEDIPPSSEDLRVRGVLNPGAARVDGRTRLLARVIEAHTANDPYVEHVVSDAKAPEYVYLPRAHNHGLHWEKKRLGKDVQANDRYSVKSAGLVEVVRPTVISHARSVEITREKPSGPPRVESVEQGGLFPKKAYEEFGIEDPRITALSSPITTTEGEYKYLISYVACSGTWGIASAFALSNDLTTFRRFPPGNPRALFHPPQKDVVVFPEKLPGRLSGREQWFALIRPGAAYNYISPSIFLLSSPDLVHWGQPWPCVAGTTEGHVGGGVPPLKTDRGWLIIYHGRRRANGGEPCYEGWAALVDYQEPWTSIHRSREPILTPFGTGGADVIPNVAFPTGAVILDDGTLEVYLGVNDTVTAVARADLDGLLDRLLRR